MKMSGVSLAKQYNAHLSNILDKHAPVVSKNILPKTKVAWFTAEARVLRALIRKCEKGWKRTGSFDDLQQFKTARMIYRKHLKDSKSSHFQEAISSANGDSRQQFHITNGLMGKKQDNLMPPGTPQVLADQFAEYFLEKIDLIKDSLKHHAKYKPKGHNTHTVLSQLMK